MFDKEAVKNSIMRLNKKYGNGTIQVYGRNLNVNIERLETEIEEIDEMLGGGLPKGRITEIFGPESAGKTTLGYHLCSIVEFASFVDAEGTFDKERAALFGVKKDGLMLSRPSCGEEAIDIICESVKANIPLIVVDSIPCLYPQKMIESEIGKDQVSPIPRLLSQQLFPKLIPLLNRSKSVILMINQIRDNITTFGWGDPHMTPGGKALKHHCTIRIEVRRREWIGAKDSRYGLLNGFRVVKSKVGLPFRSCEIPLFFEYGYCSKDKKEEVLKQLQKQRRQKNKKKRKIGG